MALIGEQLEILLTEDLTTWGQKATGVIIATPLPGSCGPLSLPAAATDTVAVTHPHHYPLPTGTFVPYGNVSNSSNSTWPPPLLPPYVNTTHLCPVRTCAEALLSKSARHITSFLNTVTLATQNLESAVLSIGGRGSTRHGSALEPRDHILEKLVLPLKDIAATLSFNLPILSAHPAIHHACDSDTITSAVSAFVDAQTALLQVLIGKVDVLLGHGDARLEDVRGRRDDETVGGDLVAHGSGVGAKEDFHIPFVDSVIRGALKLIKRGVDELVFDLIAILPSRAGCLRQEGEYLDDVLDEAIAALE